MEQLHVYLNSLSAPDQIALAKACGTTIGYSRKAISIGQRLGESLCINIGHESRRAILCDDLRPDVDWQVLRNSSHQTELIELRKRGERVA